MLSMVGLSRAVERQHIFIIKKKTIEKSIFLRDLRSPSRFKEKKRKNGKQLK